MHPQPMDKYYGLRFGHRAELDVAAFEASDGDRFEMSDVAPEAHAPHALAITEAVEARIEQRHRARIFSVRPCAVR